MEEPKNPEDKSAVEDSQIEDSDTTSKESCKKENIDYREIIENMNNKELEALYKKAEEADVYMDALQRSKADYENYRKRQERDKANFFKYANQEILRNLLNSMDNLQRAIDTVKKSEIDNSFAEGICIVQKELEKIVNDNGVTVISSKGKAFNPTYHEAISQMENADYPEMTVIEEFDRGYLYHDRVLRPSKVVVSKKPAPVVPEDKNTPEDTENLD